MTVVIATLAADGISTAIAKTAATMTLTDRRKRLTVSLKTGLAVTTAVEILTGVTAVMDSQTSVVAVSPVPMETKVIRASSLVPTKGEFRMA